MYRIAALLAVLLAAACGGGGGSEEPTETPAAPTQVGTSEVAGARTPSPTTENTPATADEYEVVSGDTLWEIAERFGTTVDALVELNGLASADVIEIGQVLKIRGSPAATATPEAQ